MYHNFNNVGVKLYVMENQVTYPVHLRLWCLHQRLENDIEVLLEVEAEGQRDVSKDWENLRFDHSMDVVVAQVLQ